ncbi:2-amino-4-hydroxy-6-hydroxymethyldihydropteridine diphosphokinase [Marivirga sp.]|uniref:2-amino-4-hydroxy-6- hydroxymethyldihydropteridine diphosphokinase n=1 Tax=Marivirga sp. TaxID=2018662 RepID=UPI002D80B547|nr:2-amino-4-hydroxy-6-hydroxymethyldihydropteridine diphosphokinase [Marivirga sp.]HET8858732.1 2-amino-4-hydroxy-6-hydroxymethyldihydropteridine diphosphokinase [Marivirga sp.]
MEGIFLLLGSNLGDRYLNLLHAVESLEKKAIKNENVSSIFETAAWGKTDQQAFLNQVLKIQTKLRPHDLLKVILEIEIDLGRVRKLKWGERLIDIDILYYHDLEIEEDDLKIPHPGIPDRKFTLTPLVEIASDFIHPILNKTQLELLNSCKDNLEVTKYNA